jgi:hypothetical protein
MPIHGTGVFGRDEFGGLVNIGEVFGVSVHPRKGRASHPISDITAVTAFTDQDSKV